MTITNRHNLPAPLVNAIRNDTYSRGASDISVTQLIQPPQPRKLLRGSEVEEDASELIWRLLGQAVHAILERANAPSINLTVEERVYTKRLGWTVSGKFDVWEDGVLSDYKITSVYAREGKIEWENQLNVLRLICAENAIPVHKLQVVAIFRDWRPKEALKDDYPKSQVLVIPVKLWPIEQAEAYLEERVRLYQQDAIPPCTDEERWHQPDKWALMKKKQKKAIKLFDEKPEHIILADDQYWEFRPGAYRRCESYCQVSSICPQWREHREAETLPDVSAPALLGQDA